MSTLKKIALKDLKTNLFVRKSLDQDHVLYLAELIEGGVQMLTPIKITREYNIIDGRHRAEAYDLCGVTEIECEVINVVGESEVIAAAYKSNIGGSLPPTQADTEHTVRLLLDRNVNKKSIGELLALPSSIARKYINTVQSRMMRAKLQEAVTAVSEGSMTVNKVAEMYGVDTDALREMISGQRKKQKQDNGSIKRTLSTSYRSLTLKEVNAIKKLFDAFEDGDVSKKQVDDIFVHIERLKKRSMKAIGDWRARFVALNGA
ncbi:ParB/RepB/Spo0J family partition protein [bacterium]|nr:ParB/RepB/Spo0J family partition protein [bacterium]